MTTTTDAIVTALGDGPATARDLSQRLDGIAYANIRQALRRLAAAGVVTKLRRGLYAISGEPADCDRGTPERAAPETAERSPEPARRRDVRTAAEMARAMARVWADFEAMNDPRDPRAWA